ncbi:MAG: TonB-dependent receptor [Bacteroidales bacterium]|nr:TonB-dependent receptor [Bacteroidales bacterium]
MGNKWLAPLLAMFFAAIGVMGQSVEGIVVDSKSKTPLEFVNVAVFKEGSDKMEKGITSNLEGEFTIKDLSKGNYELKISYVGYTTLIVPIGITDKKKDLNLGRISLKEDSKQLKEVQVTGQKSQMRFEVDKKVFSVDQNIASAGGSASDALANIPSVSVDSEGNVSLRNNSGVTIWINGKPSGISEDNSAQILEQLPAESIESVELITNPSARFSSEGSAGIINIVLKKEKKTGYYGGVSLEGNSQGGYGASGNININYNKIEAFANIGYRRFKMDSSTDSERESTNKSGDEILLIQDGDGDRGMRGLFTRAGVTYNMTKNDAFSLGANIMSGKGESNNTADYNTYTNNLLTNSYNRVTKSSNDHSMYSGTADYIHTFAKDHDLRLSAEYDYMDRGGTSVYLQNYTDTTYYQLQDGPGKNKRWEVKADYANMFNEWLRLNVGYQGNFNKSNSGSMTWVDPEKKIEETSLYNTFTYDENINAVYGTISGNSGKLSYQAGLRGEYTDYTTESLGKYTDENQDAVKRDYFNLFPSAFISYELPNQNQLQLNYTRRINRPRGRKLNSFINLTDSTNISFGNPFLQPEFTNSLELNYMKMWEAHTLSASIYYKSSSDVIQTVSYMQDNILYSTFENVTNSQQGGLELVGKNKLFKFLDLTTTVNLYYSKLDGFTFKDYDYKGTNSFSWDGRMIANVLLPWSMSLQLTGNYSSEQKTAQGKDFSRYWLDFGLRKSFMDKKLSVAITGRDILNSREMKSYRFGENFTQTSINKWGGTQIGISLTYNFGNMKSSKKKNQKNDNSMDSEMMDY